MTHSIFNGKVYDLNCPVCREHPVIKERYETFFVFHNYSSSEYVTKGSNG